MVDDSANATPLVTPPLQLYVVPPVPLKVTDDPEPIVEPGEAIAPTAGNAFTVTVIVLVLLQPLAPVPVTV